MVLCAVSPCRAQSAHSDLTGIDVPRAPLHPLEKAVTDAAQQQLTQLAGRSPQISRVELFIWTGEAYKPADSDSLMQSVEQSLRKGGYIYDVNQRRQAGDTSLTTFLVMRQSPKFTVMGAWMKGPDKLVLMWGQMGGGAAQAGANIPTPTEALLRAQGAKMVEEANIPAPIRAQVMAAAGGINLPVRGVHMMMWQPGDYKRAGAQAQIGRIAKALEGAGYACPPQQSQKTDAMDVTGFAALNAAKTQGAAGLWLATDKSLMLCWAEIGGGNKEGGSDLPGKFARQIQAQNPALFPVEKAPAAIRDSLLAYAAQKNRQCGALHLAVCRSADYKRERAGDLIQTLVNGVRSEGVTYDSDPPQKAAQGDVTMFSVTKAGRKAGVAGVWVATEQGLIVLWSDTTPNP